jgi:hypothetical protein
MVIKGILGASKLRNVQPQEAHAVACWAEDLEAALAHDPTPRDVWLIGSVAKLVIIQLRLNRKVSIDGSTKADGSPSAALTELQKVTRLASDLLQKLKLREGADQPLDIATYWGASGDATEGPASAATTQAGKESP